MIGTDSIFGARKCAKNVDDVFSFCGLFLLENVDVPLYSRALATPLSTRKRRNLESVIAPHFER